MGIGVSLINPGGTFTETRKKSSEEDRSLLETSDLGKVINPDLPSVPTGSTGGSEYPTFTGRYLLGSRWTAFFSSQGNSLWLKKSMV